MKPFIPDLIRINLPFLLILAIAAIAFVLTYVMYRRTVPDLSKAQDVCTRLPALYRAGTGAYDVVFTTPDFMVYTDACAAYRGFCG